MLTVTNDAQPSTVGDVIPGFCEDKPFRREWIAILAAVPFTAFRWETPATTVSSQTRDFECMILDDPHLEQTPDSSSFDEYFANSNQEIAVFPNLRKEALLVVPYPRGPDTAYGHLGSFVRSAPPAQQDSLWKTVGETWKHRLSKTPVWLSTAGAGVPWLHVRFDSVPKYYRYAPYRSA